MTLKCVHCGIVFEYQPPDGYDAPNIVEVLAECPNGHMAIVDFSERRAKTMTEGEK